MRMLRWMCDVTKKDKIRYEHVRSKCDIRGKVDLEKRLRCYAVMLWPREEEEEGCILNTNKDVRCTSTRKDTERKTEIQVERLV